MICLGRIRLLIVATLLFCGTVAVSAFAQKLGPDGAPNPTASVTPQRDPADAGAAHRGAHRHSGPEGQRVDPAGGTDLGLFPRGAAALGRAP
jgi:hypothetical protein